MAYYADDGRIVFANHDEIAAYYTHVFKGDKIYVEPEGAPPGATEGSKYQVIVGEEYQSPGRIRAFRLNELPQGKIRIGDALVINEKTGEGFITTREKALTMTKGIGPGIVIIIILALIIVAIVATAALVYVGGESVHKIMEDVEDMIYGGDVERKCYDTDGDGVDDICDIKYPDGSACTVDAQTNEIIRCSSVPFFGGIAGITMLIGGLALLAIGGIAVIFFGPKIIGFITGKTSGGGGTPGFGVSKKFSELKKIGGEIG